MRNRHTGERSSRGGNRVLNTARRSPNTAAHADDRLFQHATRAHQAGELDEAAKLCQRQLDMAPRSIPALLLLATITAQLGQTNRAMRLLREAIRYDRSSVDARVLLASLLREQGSPAEAIALARQAAELDPDNAGTATNLGRCYLAAARAAEAVACFERAVALEPELAGFRYDLGIALQQQGRDLEAIAAFRRAVELAPDYADAHGRLAHLLFAHGRRDEAMANLRSAIVAEPGDASAQIRLANSLMHEGQLAEAEALSRRTLALHPNAVAAHHLLGLLLSQMGRFSDGIAQFERALAIEPRHASSWLGIVSARRITPADGPLIARMTASARDQALADSERATLHYALGKAFDDLARYAEAMPHFEAANAICLERLRLAGNAIDRDRHAADVDRLIATFTPEFLAQSWSLGSASDVPILVVGMPRSGTTLVEQVVSSHPGIAAGGELRFWGERGTLHAELAAGNFTAEAARQTAVGYEGLLRSLGPTARRVTDKMPTNFLLLGLIHLIFPQARIIHCRRNPVDTCLSIYLTPYSNTPDFAHDRATIVFYYQQYLRLMAHWRRVLPAERLLDVDYERLITDRESVTRQMIAFCGMDWDASCLRPENNATAISTPSRWQARQPVYRTAMDRWRNYEPWLGALRRLLPVP